MATYRIEQRDAGLRRWRVAEQRQYRSVNRPYWTEVARFWSREAAQHWIAKRTWRAERRGED